MKILYAIASEGLGHLTRSQAVIDQLNQNILIVTGGRPYNILKEKYKNITKIEGLNIIYKKNKVANLSTFLMNLKKFHKVIQSYKKIKHVIKHYKPDVIISDFEPVTNWAALFTKIPILTIDNQHLLTKIIPKKHLLSYLKSLFIILLFQPRKTKSFIISQKNIIVRPQLTKLKPKKGKHILVYQTSKSNKNLIKTLLNTKEQFIVYNLNKDVKLNNITFKNFNEKQFYKDLANCKAIITNGGFSLISEAIYLKKPILTQPIKSQFEQEYNALEIKKLKIGKYTKTISPKIINNFLNNLKFYEDNYKNINPKVNDITRIKQLIHKLGVNRTK